MIFGLVESEFLHFRQGDGPNFGSVRMWKSPRMRAHQPDLDVKGQQEGIQCTGGMNTH